MTTKIELLKRREEVLQQLLNFRGHTYIQDYIQTKYEVGKKAVEKDITNAYITISKDYPIDTQTIVKKHIAMYYDLASDAKEMGDSKGAANILGMIEKLLKLHQPEVAIQVNSNTLNIDALNGMNVEDLKLLLGED